MKFVDYVTIAVRSGSGGSGAVAFRREKYVPKGGPVGGDGGDGGSVILMADERLYTLLDLRYRRHHFADNGMHGSGGNKKGKDGDDLFVRVPPGTVATNLHTGESIGEVHNPGDTLILAAGGMGGRGNAFFKSATHQAPRHAQPGIPGEEVSVALELKLLADVGLVGFPNAGKSTLLSVLSAARPKIADYPFTTLEPQLGVVRVEEYKSFVMADIPGIIEDAHKGKGLGLRFLKHIERNAVLLFVIPVTEANPAEHYEVLLEELSGYAESLLTKPRLVALSKTDLLGTDASDEIARLQGVFPADTPVLGISAVAQTGLDALKRTLFDIILRERSADIGDQL
jgi:GTP-binding protein